MKEEYKISDLSVDQLRVELKKRKIAQVGPKAALVKRLKKVLTDEGLDPDTYTININALSSDKGSSSDEKCKSPSKEAKSGGEAKEEEKKSSGSPPKRALRRSTREKSPAISTPTKTPRAVRGKSKLPAVNEEDGSNSSSQSMTDKKVVTNNEEKEDKLANGENDSNKAKSPEKKTDKKESEEVKTSVETTNVEKEESKNTDDIGKEDETKENTEESEEGGKEVEEKAGEEEIDEEAEQAELDLQLDDMEQADYEEELNFDCGSTLISDNDADLDQSKEDLDRKSKRKSTLSNQDNKKSETISEKADEKKETNEEKEKSKSPQKTADKSEESSKSLEKGENEKDDNSPKDLWVTGLSNTVKAADLKQTFLQHGKVISTKIVMNPKLGSQCFGIVTVTNQEEAMKCVKALNVTEVFGRFITVKIIAKKKDQDKKDEKKSKDDDKKDKASGKRSTSPSRSKDRSARSSDGGRSRDMRRDRDHIRGRLGPRGAVRRPPPRGRPMQQDLRLHDLRRQDMIERRRAAIGRRMAEEQARQEVLKLNREREMLRMEREKIEREKVELLRLERERLEREKEEIRKQHQRLEEARRKRDMPSRDSFDSRPKRPMNDRHYSDRRSPPHSGHHGPQSYPRRDERPPSGRFESRDRYENDRGRSDGWRGEENQGRMGGGPPSSSGPWSNKSQGGWPQPPQQSHDRDWNSGSSSKSRMGGGYNSSGGPPRGPPSSYSNRGPPASSNSGPSMNPYPPPQQHHNHSAFNPYPPPKY